MNKKQIYLWGLLGCALITILYEGIEAYIRKPQPTVRREYGYDISPDGKRIVYASAGSLRMLDLGTRKATPLQVFWISDTATPVTDPAFSSNGKFLAFSTSSEYSEICATRQNGEQLWSYIDDRLPYSNYAPRFSPDGNYLVFARQHSDSSSSNGGNVSPYEVWTVHRGIEKVDLLQITQGKYRWVSGMQYAPDGNTILFAAGLPQESNGKERQVLLEVEADGKRSPREIFGSKAESAGWSVTSLALSPDGKEFVLVAEHLKTGHYDLCTLKRDGTDFRPLKVNRAGSKILLEKPRFSPDGKQIYYLRRDTLWQIDRDGHNPREVAQLQ